MIGDELRWTSGGRNWRKNLMVTEPKDGLWNCNACGTKNLLVKAHSFCPNCGCMQRAENPTGTGPDPTMPIESHLYVGSDQICPYCASANSEAAKHCVGCGVGLTNLTVAGAQVSHVSGFSTMTSDFSRKMLSEYTQYNKTKPGSFFWFDRLPSALKGFVIVFLIGLTASIYGLFHQYWQEHVSVTVVGHSWTRNIDIEKYNTFYESRWCSDMPKSARDVQIAKQVKSYDSSACQAEDKNCRAEPVYADHCSYAIERWGHHITMVESGDRKDDTPSWPELGELAVCDTDSGCERVASRSERYTIHFRADEDSEDEVYTCDFPQETWRRINLAEHYQGPRGALYGSLDCDKLTKLSNGAPPITVAH